LPILKLLIMLELFSQLGIFSLLQMIFRILEELLV